MALALGETNEIKLETQQEPRLELRTVVKFKYALHLQQLNLRMALFFKFKEKFRVIAFDLTPMKVLDKIVKNKKEAEGLLIETFGSGLEKKNYVIPWVKGDSNPDVISLLLDLGLKSELEKKAV